MNPSRLFIGTTTAALAAVVVLLGGIFVDRGHGDSHAVLAPALDVVAPHSPGGDASSSSSSTSVLVRSYEEQLREGLTSVGLYVQLGLAYQQRARETADPSFYGLSERALERALAIDPANDLAISGLGSLALSRHRFHEALALGERARRLAPSIARNYGVVGDAQIELGRYREAFASFDQMTQLKPSLSAYARVSYARELLGNLTGAFAAMELAAAAATGQPEATAWTDNELGKLYWIRGQNAKAARQFELALIAMPGYPYALDNLARVEAARGHLARAIALSQRAVTQVPLPQFVTTLGDLLARSGRTKEAREQYALVAVIDKLLAANGVKTDLEQALFDVDHGARLRQTVALARRARADRPSIYGDDVLAWALARNGRCGEALRWSQRAGRLRTKDSLIFFHRGWIERCLGNRDASQLWFGRALALNPDFSILWSPVAKRAVS